VTALRNRSLETMYRPGKTASLIADLAPGLALIAVGVYVIVAGLARWLTL